MAFSRFHTRIATLVGLVILTTPAMAQTPAWNVPASGYVYDPLNRDIRPIAGFLGSAVLGSSVVGGIDWASVAPNQNSALLQQGAAMVWISSLAAPDQTQSLDGMPVTQQILWASDSSRAVMLADRSRLVWLNGLNSPTAAAPTWHVDTLSALYGRGEGTTWSLLAADAASDKVLLTSRSGSQRQLWMASAGKSPVLIPFSGQPAAAVFAAGGSTFFIADTAASQIVQFSGLGSAPLDSTMSSAPLLTSALYVNDPAGLALSTDGSRLFIADHATSIIRVFDSTSGTLISELTSDAAPQALTAFAPGIFLLNSGNLPPGPFLFLNTSSPSSVLFVPRGE